MIATLEIIFTNKIFSNLRKTKQKLNSSLSQSFRKKEGKKTKYKQYLNKQ